ncbi:hypothetical protein CC86DRAFT_368541 [Ophiobolus disseminans]|uniref:Uncharacterized protein n=1 Tax=Ophiobolus disseminans TaxID=1469910 RepID=A0A6A7AA99_9PLEO|nr:hypothetical protein CC86DRAFT_368541 [Ophiobolus disseminans]
MRSSLLANILFFLSVLGLVAAAADAEKLAVRQTQVQPTQQQLCADYEWTANMSTIGANGTYRTVLLQRSNVGTIYNARMMDAAIKKLPPMTADKELNERCGNKTQIALVEAEANFTQNIVAQYSAEGLPVGIYAGPAVIPIVGAVAIIFSVVWVFS